MIGEQFTGDYVVANQSVSASVVCRAPVGLELGRIDGVAAAAGIQIGGARIDGTDQTVTVIDPHVVGRVFDLGCSDHTSDPAVGGSVGRAGCGPQLPRSSTAARTR